MVEVHCDAPIVYEDENICILNPRIPENKTKGVLFVHIIGYMEPIGKDPLNSLMFKIKEEGLKTSHRLILDKKKQLLENKKPFNPNNNSNIRARAPFLKYNEQHFQHIFFRPPTTAPFAVKDGNLISAGPWREFLGTENEDRMFFGGKSLQELASAGSSSLENYAQGIATIRVDPDKTFVYYEAMKDGTGNRNKETGIKIPQAQTKRQKPRNRFASSRIRLSSYLDQLQQNLEGKPPHIEPYAVYPNQIVEDRWEAFVTKPKSGELGPCAFEQIASLSELAGSTETETDADKKMKEFTNKFYANYTQKTSTLINEVDTFLESFQMMIPSLRKKTENLQIVLGTEINPRAKIPWKKSEEAKKLEIQKLRDEIQGEKEELETKFASAMQNEKKPFHPVQYDLVLNGKDFFDRQLQRINETLQMASKFLEIKKTSGGRQTRKKKKIRDL